MLINRDGLVWVGRRRPKWAADATAYIWQMPQGGIKPGEAERAAALRELEEETGVTSVELLAEAPRLAQLRSARGAAGHRAQGPVPRPAAEVVRHALHRPRRRDRHRRTRRPQGRVRRLALGRRRELPGLIVPFKRQVYADVVREFGRWVG